MSTETGEEKRQLSKSISESEEGATGIATTEDVHSSEESNVTKPLDEPRQRQDTDETDQKKDGGTTAASGKEVTVGTPSNSNNNVIPGDGSRQIIAVSANKNPTAFFQLARKFLMTNEMCDLSALEGAIVSAVDAAHLLERSKLASIVRIHTSYVNVEPKRRRQVWQQKGDVSSAVTTEGASSSSTLEDGSPSFKVESSSLPSNVNRTTNTEEQSQTSSSLISKSIPDSEKHTKVSGTQQEWQQSTTTSTTRSSATSLSGSGSRELRRARILVTVKRTESYKRWLEENPTQRQAIIAGTATVTAENISGGVSSSNNNETPELPTAMEQAPSSS